MHNKLNKPFSERIRPIFEKYSSLKTQLVDADPKTFFPAQYWAALKLYCFAAYIHSCYIPIISKNPMAREIIGDSFYFIDLLSGSGINLICSERHRCGSSQPDSCPSCSKGVYTVGSALLAATSNPPFKKMFFVDNDGGNSKTLEKRLEILKRNGMCNGDYAVKTGDCNLVLPELIKEIKSKGAYHFLAFVDNQGFDASWKTIDQLLDCYGDLVITFPTSDIIRNLPIESSEPALKEFLGFDNISDVGTDPLAYYLGKITAKGKLAESISVKTGMSYHYDLIIVTKPKAPFWGVIEHIKKNIENNTAKEAEMAFSIIAGKQKSLSFDWDNLSENAKNDDEKTPES